MLARQLQQPVREIVYRTRGDAHGPIARLVSPSDLGELIKPFVFLDRFDFDGRPAPMEMELGWHPHSGIATVTVVLEGSIRYSETTGKGGVLSTGSVEWMRAGNGVWHTGAPEPGHVKGFQLWVAVQDGALRSSSRIPSGEIAIFEPSEESIDFVAEGNTRFVLGSAAKHPHDLVLGNYSVHTTPEALRQGEAEIRRIGQKLRADGTLRR